MLKNFDYKIISVMCMLMLSITSCVTGNDADSAKPATIRLSLGTGSTAKTRANTGFPTDNGGTVGSGEGSIYTVCVGLFDANGNTITIHEYTYTNGQSEDILTTTQATKMVVVANAKSGAFAGATTESDFLQKVQQLSYTTSDKGQGNTNATTAGGQTITALPMCSKETSLTLSGSSATSMSVDLTRVVARVSLSSITTNFDSSGPYAGATFTPTEVFMYNVDDQYEWNGTASASATTVSGESTASTSFAYLGTGTTNYTAPTSKSPQFFYVFPHGSTSPTKLVIKGTFTPKGGTAQTMYYPVVVNHAQSNTTFTDASGNTTTNTDDATIEANKTYNITVKITGLGVTDPSNDVDPSSVTINSQVQDWIQAAVTINMNDVPGIGEYYFSDGSWGTLTDRATSTVYPIGVVFSNTTSVIDKAHGWTHGYAMALTNAATNYTTTSTCLWAGSNYQSTEEAGDTYIDSYENFKYQDYTTYTDFITDKDGYSETQAIKNKYSSTLKTDHPALYYALNYGTSNESTTIAYTAPNGSSGWYLPSVGQGWDIVTKLGGMSTTVTNISSGCCRWYKGDDNSNNNYTSICVDNINKYLTGVSSYSNSYKYNYKAPDLFSDSGMEYGNDDGTYSAELYCLSSEYDIGSIYNISFDSSLGMYLSGNYKTLMFRVRPVIAF